MSPLWTEGAGIFIMYAGPTHKWQHSPTRLIITFPHKGKKEKEKEKNEAAGRTRGMMRGAWLGSDDDDSWASRASDGHGEGSPRWMLPVVVVVMGGVRDVGVASFVI